jgi:hypothetical protein
MAAVALPIVSLWDGSPCRHDEGAQVTLQRVAGGALLVSCEAPLHGDPAPPGPPGPTWELWEHEVVEVFLLGDDERYTEVEIGPHGHHLVLRLHGRRAVVEKLLPLDLSVRVADGRWTAQARVPAELVPPGPLRGNAYAIHGVGAGRRYLAWTPVPGDEPDFHRLELFAPLEI